MGCRIFEGWERGEPAGACTKAIFFCSTTMWAFGPVVESEKGWTAVEIAEKFRESVGVDLRAFSEAELEGYYISFMKWLPEKIG